METKYTPPPWIASGPYVQALYTPAVVGKPFYRDIARTDTHLSTPQDSAANAILMAASPELLEALLNALPYVTDVLDNPEQLACFKKGVVHGHVKQMRNAIEKATGEQR
jgi:hypothetical protein